MAFTTKEMVSCMQTFNKGQNCIAGTKNGSIHIWNTQTGNMLAEISAHYEEITSMALSQDESMVVTGCKGGTIKLWIIADLICASSSSQTNDSRFGESQAQEIANFKGHTESITSLFINKFTNKLYSSSLDNLCIVWDLFTGMQIRQLNCSSPVISMAVETLETVVYLACKNKNVY